MKNASISAAEKVKKRTSLASTASAAKVLLFGASTRLSIVIAACILTFHGAVLTWGSVLLWHSDLVWLVALPIGFMDLMLLARLCRPARAKDWWYHPMVFHLAVAITATWLILVGMYIDPVRVDRESTIINTTTEELDEELQELRNSDARQSIDLLSNSVLRVNLTWDLQFDTIAYVGIQLTTPVIIFTRWMMPRIDLTSEQFSSLLLTGVALSFDIVELQDNIQNEELRNNEILAYLILVFSSLSLLQLLQLSEALARRVVSSRKWEMFWTIYGVVCQEIPFLLIRGYIMIVSGFEIIQLIFPLKNAFSIVFGCYHIVAIMKTLKKEENEEKRRLSSSLAESPSSAKKSVSGSKTITNNATKAETLGEELGDLKNSSDWSRTKPILSLVVPTLFFMAHLILLTWRVTSVNDNMLFWLLSLSVVPFTAITIPRIIQYKRSASKKIKAPVWYQPLLVYLLVAVSCFWLIILPLADNNKFLSIDSIHELTSGNESNKANTSICGSDTKEQQTSSFATSLLPLTTHQLVTSTQIAPSSTPTSSLLAAVFTSPTTTATSNLLVDAVSASPNTTDNSSLLVAAVSVSSTTTVSDFPKTAAASSLFIANVLVAPTRTATNSLLVAAVSASPNTTFLSTALGITNGVKSSKSSIMTGSSSSVIPSTHSPSLRPTPTPAVTCRERTVSDTVTLEPEDPTLADELSYALLQLVLPLTVFGRWCMPKGGLTSEAFSSLLQVAVAMAFDIAEFTHLIVDEPDLHKDRTLLILVLVFTSTSILLLVQIDVGMASDKKQSKIIWTLMTILFLDGPFFCIRIYIALKFNTENLQLVFLLKNLFGIIFGGYHVLSLLSTKDKESETQEEATVNVSDDYVFEMYANRTATSGDANERNSRENGPGDIVPDHVPHDANGLVIPNEAAKVIDAEVSHKDDEGHKVNNRTGISGDVEETKDSGNELGDIVLDQVPHDVGGLVIPNEAAVSTDAETSRKDNKGHEEQYSNRSEQEEHSKMSAEHSGTDGNEEGGISE